jgi:DNA-binding NtrC family response regulator
VSHQPPYAKSPAILGAHAVIVSADAELADRLKGWLQGRFGCETEWAVDDDAACSHIRRTQASTLFLDLRGDAAAASVRLLKLLARLDQFVAIIGVGQPDGGGDCAGRHVESGGRAEALMRVHGWLSASFGLDELATLLCDRLAGSLLASSEGPAAPSDILFPECRFRTCSEALRLALTSVANLAPHAVTLFLSGERGVGKATLARQLHLASPRAAERFLIVPCGDLAGESLEVELFGQGDPSASGDGATTGKIEAVGAGTLLIRDLELASMACQAKILRVCETGEYEPVRSHASRRSLARFVLTSQCELSDLHAQGKIRPELYFYLAAFSYSIPPLRERRRDILPLALDLLEELRYRHGVDVQRVDPAFLASLLAHDWPGSVRELRSRMERAILLSRDGAVTGAIPARNARAAPPREGLAAPPAPRAVHLTEQMAEQEIEIIQRTLRKHGYPRTATAEALRISRAGLYKKMKRYGLLGLGVEHGARGEEAPGV